MGKLISGVVGAIVGVGATFGVYLLAASGNSDPTSYVVPVECSAEDSCELDYDRYTDRWTVYQVTP